MNRSPAIAPWSIGGIAFLVTVCMTPVSLGRPYLTYAGYGTLLWMLLAFATAMLGTQLNLSLNAAQLRGWADGVRNFLAYLRAPFFLMGAAAMLHTWLNMQDRTQLPSTPRLAEAIMTAALAIYVIRVGIENVGRVVGLLAVVAVVPLFLLIIGAWPNAELHRLLPYPLGTGAIPWIWPTIVFCPRGYDMLPVFGPLAKGDLRKPVFLGVGLGALYLVAAIALPQLIFGLTAAQQLTSPFLSAIETVTSIFLPFQRISFLSIIVWQMIVFGIVATYSVSGLASLGVRVFPLTPWTYLLPWMAIVVGLSVVLLPEDIFSVVKNAWSSYGLFLYLVLPSLLLAFGRRRAARRALPA